VIDPSKTPPHGNVLNTHKRQRVLHSAYSNTQCHQLGGRKPTPCDPTLDSNPLQSKYALHSIARYDTKAQHTVLKRADTRSKSPDYPFPNNATLTSQCLPTTPPYET